MAQVKSIELDDDENIEFVTVRMSAEEAALIAIFTGKQNVPSVEAIMRGGGPANSHLYEAFTVSVFNRWYDGGVQEWHRDHF